MSSSSKKAAPSAEQYKSALAKLAEEGKIGEKIKAMLRCHYHSPNRTTTFSQLAQAADYKDNNGAQIQYGKFGHLLGDLLKTEFSQSTTRKKGTLFYCSVIGDSILGSKPEHFKLKMHDELASALKMLEWVTGNKEENCKINANNDSYTNSDSYNNHHESDDEKYLVEIKARRGQPLFRKLLIEAYNGKCAVTQTAIEELLEAAHITPHAEGVNYSANNGLLLRADIHTLFDLRLLSIDENMRIHLSKSIKQSKEYGHLHLEKITLPDLNKHTPDRYALGARHKKFLEDETRRNSISSNMKL